MSDLSVHSMKELTAPSSYPMLAGDERGLYIQMKPSDRKSWVLRYKTNQSGK